VKSDGPAPGQYVSAAAKQALASRLHVKSAPGQTTRRAPHALGLSLDKQQLHSLELNRIAGALEEAGCLPADGAKQKEQQSSSNSSKWTTRISTSPTRT
jgi:hypothetical protein